MANRIMSPKKQKKSRITKDQNYLINVKYIGPEPEFTKQPSKSELIKALNWYNCMSNVSEAKEYINEYLKLDNRNSDIKKFKGVSDAFIPLTAAWYIRLSSRGYTLEDNDIRYVDNKIKEAIERVKKPEAKEKKEVISIQDRVKERTSEILAELEDIVDNREQNKGFSLYEWLKAKQIPASYSPAIINAYQGWLNELLDAYAGVDKQLKEAYKSFPKSKMVEDIGFFNSIIEDAQKYSDVTKKTRAPRKPRAVSIEKKLKGFKYQKEDSTFKIASINPEKIIGASELWTFNTKYKTLTVIRAIDRGGLQVKGTSIINYDENTSMTKRTGRKAEYFVQRVLNGGKIVLRKLMDEDSMGNKTNLAHRINENTILLKVS